MGVKAYGLICMYDNALKRLQKEQMAEKKITKKEQPRYLTGCTLLDMALGGSKGVLGIEGGKWLNLVGDASSGKSLLSLEVNVANKYKYKDDFKALYDDTENGFTFDPQERYGFSLKPDWAVDSETVEGMSCQFTKFLESLKPEDRAVYTIDSLDGLADAATVEMDEDRQKAFEKEKDYEQKTYGMGLPKFLSSNYFKLKHGLLDDTGALCIITSQVRQNVNAGMYGAKWIRAGGKALDLYSNYIIWLKTLQQREVDGKKIGAVVHAKITKAKVERPYREVIYTVLYSYGIDDVGSNVDFLFDLRSDKTGELLKRAEKIVWEEGMEPLNRDQLIEYIEENKLKKKLKQRVIDKWEEREDAVAIKRSAKYDIEDEE